jgi:solute carrier family 45, member 1/2/4
MKTVCSAWAYWFPLLFFSSEYVAELYKIARDASGFIGIDEDATLRGARAMFFNSLVAMATGILAPWLTARPGRRSRW